MSDSPVVMRGTLKAIPVVLAVFEFDFMGGSMGSVIGERFVRGVHAAVAAHVPFLCVTASGGARMQEGLFSLLQMALTTFLSHGSIWTVFGSGTEMDASALISIMEPYDSTRTMSTSAADARPPRTLFNSCSKCPRTWAKSGFASSMGVAIRYSPFFHGAGKRTRAMKLDIDKSASNR
jgi:hypothetical protein